MLKYFYTILLVVFSTLAALAQPGKPSPALVAFNNGKAFKARGMHNESIASFKKAINFNKKYDSAYLELAKLYAATGKADSAVMILDRSTKLIPDFAGAYILMGDLYRDYIKNPDLAIKNYLNAIKIDSTNKTTYYSLAWCNNAKEYYREAIKYGIKALELDNNYKPAYNELGHAYRQLKAYEECVDQFKKNLAISVNDLPMLYSGYSYMELNQKENALKMYEELNKLNPKMAGALKKRLDAMQ
jgi:tetratricopeptide (TPR) repeat protein